MFKARISYAHRPEDRGKGWKEWTSGNKPSPYRWILLWELRPETPVKTINPPAPLRVQGTTTKNFGKGQGNKIQYHNS